MFLTQAEVFDIGFNKVGRNVRISPQARFHNPECVSIRDNVRIDDFVVISGHVEIGSYVHLSVHSTIIAPRSKVRIDDFSTMSFYSCITSANDDYSGLYMTNPTVPREFTNVSDKPVHVDKHVIIGAHSLVLPGVTLNTGCAIGAFSLIKFDVPGWETHAGVPARKIGLRSNVMLKFASKI